MNIDSVFSGSFLKADDLKGKNARVVIETCEVKEFDDGNKIVLTFKGKDKALVCNKTNASILAEVCGSRDTDNWVGKAVTLTVKKVEYAGKLVPAIRVLLEESAPVAAKPSPAKAPCDENGEVDPEVGF